MLLTLLLMLPADASNSQCDTLEMTVGAPVPTLDISPMPVVTVASTSSTDIRAAADQIRAAGGGTLHFPAGTYIVELQVRQESTLSFEGLDALAITGEGDTSILQVDADPDIRGTQMRAIRVMGARQFALHDIRLEGQRVFMDAAGTPPIGENQYWAEPGRDPAERLIHSNNEQQSLVFLRDITEATHIHHTVFRHAGGDAVNISNLANVVLEHNDLDDLGRNGFTIGGLRTTQRTTNVLIQHNWFGPGIDTQQIDTELHDTAADPHPFVLDPALMNGNVQVLHNTFEAHVPQDTIARDQYAMTITETDQVLFAHNTVRSPIYQANATNVRIQDNTEIPGLIIIRNGSAEITGNAFDLHPVDRAVGFNAGIDFEERAAIPLHAITLRDNIIRSTGLDRVVAVHDVLEAWIEDNTFVDLTGHSSILRVEGNRTDVVINEFGNGLAPDDISVSTWGGGTISWTYDGVTCDLCLADEDDDGVCDDVDPCYLDNTFDYDGDGICEPWLDGDMLIPGAPFTLVLDNAEPGSEVTFVATLRGLGAGYCMPSDPETCLDLVDARIIGSSQADADGIATFSIDVPPLASGTRVDLQAIWRGTRMETSNVIRRYVP